MPRDGQRDIDQMFAALYADHGSELHRYAAHLTGNRSRADDIVQETMLRAWRHPEAARRYGGNMRAWLYTVARHLVIDQHRAQQARPAEVGGMPVPVVMAAPDQIDAAITHWDLVAALARLRRRDRALLTAHYLSDRSITEIAAEFKVPAGTIKSRLSTARDALRRVLQPATSHPGQSAGREAVHAVAHRQPGVQPALNDTATNTRHACRTAAGQRAVHVGENDRRNTR
jgi:RNA polymerase sigma-70 factor (ECF subfamily)